MKRPGDWSFVNQPPDQTGIRCHQTQRSNHLRSRILPAIQPLAHHPAWHKAAHTQTQQGTSMVQRSFSTYVCLRSLVNEACTHVWQDGMCLAAFTRGLRQVRITTTCQSVPNCSLKPESCAPPFVPVIARLTVLALLLHTHLTGPCQGFLLSTDVVLGNIWLCSVSHSRHLPWSTQSRNVTVKVIFTHWSQFGNTPA